MKEHKHLSDCECPQCNVALSLAKSQFALNRRVTGEGKAPRKLYYDYTLQAWIENGVVAKCGHEKPFRFCYACSHHGENEVYRNALLSAEAENNALREQYEASQSALTDVMSELTDAREQVKELLAALKLHHRASIAPEGTKQQADLGREAYLAYRAAIASSERRAS